MGYYNDDGYDSYAYDEQRDRMKKEVRGELNDDIMKILEPMIDSFFNFYNTEINVENLRNEFTKMVLILGDDPKFYFNSYRSNPTNIKLEYNQFNKDAA